MPGLEFRAPLLDEDIHKVGARLKGKIRSFMAAVVLIPVPRVEWNEPPGGAAFGAVQVLDVVVIKMSR